MRELAFVELCLLSALHAEGGPESAVGVRASVHACVCVCRQLYNYERRASKIPVEQISVLSPHLPPDKHARSKRERTVCRYAYNIELNAHQPLLPRANFGSYLSENNAKSVPMHAHQSSATSLFLHFVLVLILIFPRSNNKKKCVCMRLLACTQPSFKLDNGL